MCWDYTLLYTLCTYKWHVLQKMLVILQWNSANIKSVCSYIIIKDSQPKAFMWVEEDSKPFQKFYITGVPHTHNGIYIVNRSYWWTFHILTLTPSSVNEQVITITACILSPSSAHDHDFVRCYGSETTMVHADIYSSHTFYYPYKYGKQVTKATIVMILYLNMAENVKCY
jgi:hypothetical protein